MAVDSILSALEHRLARWAAVSRLERWGPPAAILSAISLFLPTLVRGRTFASDWAAHLYYVARQSEQIRELGRPSHFLHADPYGAFYPYFAFYGGSLYALTAATGLLLHSVSTAYISSLALAFSASYGGVYWLGRLLGLTREIAHLPSLVLVTSSYFLTNAYGRGAWGELLATSFVPMIAASALALVRAERPGLRESFLLVVSAAIFSGSHSISLVWGSLFLGFLLCLAVILSRVPSPRPARLGRLGTVAGLFVVGVGINGWFLVPALAYGRSTHIGAYAARGFGSDAQTANAFAVLFHPGRTIPPGMYPDLYTQVSVYVLLWVAVAGAVLVSRAARTSRIAWMGLALLLLLYLTLIMQSRLDLPWRLMPRVLKIVQFQFRLHTYVTFCIVGLVILGLREAIRSRRMVWVAGLLLAVAIQLGLAEYQVWIARTYFPLSEIVNAGTRVPHHLAHHFDYRFRTGKDERELGEPVLPRPTLQVMLDLDAIEADRAQFLSPPGVERGPVLTNVNYSPFIETEGDLVVLGRTEDGLAVVDRRDPGANGPWNGAVRAARPWPVRLGSSLSVASMVAATAALWAMSGARRRS